MLRRQSNLFRLRLGAVCSHARQEGCGETERQADNDDSCVFTNGHSQFSFLSVMPSVCVVKLDLQFPSRRPCGGIRMYLYTFVRTCTPCSSFMLPPEIKIPEEACENEFPNYLYMGSSHLIMARRSFSGFRSTLIANKYGFQRIYLPQSHRVYRERRREEDRIDWISTNPVHPVMRPCRILSNILLLFFPLYSGISHIPLYILAQLRR